MKVKICGVLHPDDAKNATKLGSDYIGINFSPLSKRYVDIAKGKEIAMIARENGAEAVGVFVEESPEQIFDICSKTSIKMVQLHGNRSKMALESLIDQFSIIFAISVDNQGGYLEKEQKQNVICLFDYMKGGSGKSFNWAAFSPPSNTPWILAGGLSHHNVQKAISILKPYCVDVASGVEFGTSLRKDPFLVKEFIRNAKNLEEKL